MLYKSAIMKKQLLILSVGISALLFSLGTNAQFGILNKAKEKVISRIDAKVDQKMDQGLDSIENGVKTKPQDKQSIPQTEGTVANQQTPMLQSYSKYDFITGEKIIYFDDFSETAIGDFSPNWNTNASGEVVSTNQYAGHWFRMTGSGCVALEEGLKLPDNYTVEFDVILSPADSSESSFEFGFYLYNAQNPRDLNEGGAIPGNNGIKMNFADYRATYSAYQDGAYTLDGEKDNAGLIKDKKYRLSFWVQKTRLRVYLD